LGKVAGDFWVLGFSKFVRLEKFEEKPEIL
jgi:hypothetical protein